MKLTEKEVLLKAAIENLEGALEKEPGEPIEVYETERYILEYIRISKLTIDKDRKDNLLEKSYNKILKDIKSTPKKKTYSSESTTNLIQIVALINSLPVED